MKVRVAGVIMEGNKVLTLRYRYGGVDVFAIPGGNLDFGETMKEALVREYKEELSIFTEVKEEAFSCETLRETEKTLHQLYWLKIKEGEPIINSSETTALEVCWLEIDKLETYNLYPNVGTYIKESSSLKDKYLGDVQQQWF
ncbi:MAG: 8-oxo-dGTP diphosphatase [Arcticibacterium sp.]